MFCNQCGSPNPDNSKFCSSCGQPIQKIEMKAPVEPVAPQPEKPAEAKPVQETKAPPVSENTNKTAIPKSNYQKKVETKEEFSRRFCTEWRSFMTSPMVVATLITYTVFAVTILIGAATITDALFEFDGVFFSLDNTDGLYFVLFIAIIAPAILFGAGLWMIFYDAYDQSSRPINITGLQIIKGTLVGVLSVSCFALFIAFIASLATDDFSSGFSFVDYDSVMSVVILVALITAFYVFTFKLLNNIMGIAEYCIPDTSYLISYAIALIVAAGLELVVMLSSGFNVIMLLSCAVAILFGMTLLFFREFMLNLKEQAPKNSY